MTKSKAPNSAASGKATAATGDLRQPTKSAAVLTLMQREQGATLAELVEVTGWQPHTARATLTGLRKKGHAIERRKRDQLSCYHLPAAEA